MSKVGKSEIRVDAFDKVTGRTKYYEDQMPNGALYVRIKHSTVMCPELIRVFALDDHADFITAAWDEINLHTITRGISRFESVRLVFFPLMLDCSR